MIFFTKRSEKITFLLPEMIAAPGPASDPDSGAAAAQAGAWIRNKKQIFFRKPLRFLSE